MTCFCGVCLLEKKKKKEVVVADQWLVVIYDVRVVVMSLQFTASLKIKALLAKGLYLASAALSFSVFLYFYFSFREEMGG